MGILIVLLGASVACGQTIGGHNPGVTAAPGAVLPTFAPTYGPTTTPDLSKSLVQAVTITNSSAWILGNPLNAVSGQTWTLELISGVGITPGTLTLGGQYRSDGSVTPPAATKRTQCRAVNESATFTLIGGCTPGA